VHLWSVFYDADQQALRSINLLSSAPYFSPTVVAAAGPLVELSELVTSNHGYGPLALAYSTSGDNAVHVAKGFSYRDWIVSQVDSGGPSPLRFAALDFSNYRLNISYAGPAGELMYGISASTQTHQGYNPLEPCFDDPVAAVRALAAAPHTFRPISPGGAAAATDLDVLRAARDLFATDPDGQHLITLYYTHAAETGGMAIADPDLALDAFNTLQNFLPGIRALVSAEGYRILVTQAMVDEANHMADRLASAGSPGLAADIAAERARYHQLQDFAGLTFAEAAARIGVPAPTRLFLPLVTR
jgi:hypothetical protein